jgi:hypothetical protein
MALRTPHSCFAIHVDLKVTDTPAEKVGVMHRWSNRIGPYPLGPSNDQLVVFNFRNKFYPGAL